MRLFLSICFIVFSIGLTTYLSVENIITGKTKILVWIFTFFVASCGVTISVIDFIEKKKKLKASIVRDKFDAKEMLRDKGFPLSYINSLEGNPKLRHWIIKAKKYEEEKRFEVDEERRKCSLKINNIKNLLNRIDKYHQKFNKQKIQLNKRVGMSTDLLPDHQHRFFLPLFMCFCLEDFSS